MVSKTTGRDRRVSRESGRSRRRVAPRDEPPAKTGGYSLESFCDDHRRLLSASAPTISPPPATVQLVDGRMVVVLPDLLARVARRRQLELFRRKYADAAESAWARFRAVMDFMSQRAADLQDSGLARGAPFLAVREEFVDYLLACEPSEGEPMPDGVLEAFLDQWSHRWM